MKKTKTESSKPTKTTTPATPAPVPAKKVPAKAKTSKPIAAPASTVTTPPIVKADAPSPVLTTVVAQIDVGFGNSLFVRGEGPGLSWEKGVPLDCIADDKWSITLPETSKPIVFKFLINDLTWCAGEDFVIQPGASLTVVPVF